MAGDPLPPRKKVGSYQFAPSTVEGWNDCPILPAEKLSGRRSRSSSRPRRTSSYVSFLNESGPVPSQRSVSSTSINSLPPRPLSKASSTTSLVVPEEADERKLEAELETINVEDELQKLFARKSTLSEKELEFYSARLNDGEILKSKENGLFLASILKDLEAGQDKLQIDTKILDFMKNHVGITWCVSLRRIVAGL